MITRVPTKVHGSVPLLEPFLDLLQQHRAVGIQHVPGAPCACLLRRERRTRPAVSFPTPSRVLLEWHAHFHRRGVQSFRSAFVPLQSFLLQRLKVAMACELAEDCAFRRQEQILIIARPLRRTHLDVLWCARVLTNHRGVARLYMQHRQTPQVHCARRLLKGPVRLVSRLLLATFRTLADVLSFRGHDACKLRRRGSPASFEQ